MLELIRNLSRHLELKQLIIDHFIPPDVLQKVFSFLFKKKFIWKRKTKRESKSCFLFLLTKNNNYFFSVQILFFEEEENKGKEKQTIQKKKFPQQKKKKKTVSKIHWDADNEEWVVCPPNIEDLRTMPRPVSARPSQVFFWGEGEVVKKKKRTAKPKKRQVKVFFLFLTPPDQKKSIFWFFSFFPLERNNEFFIQLKKKPGVVFQSSWLSVLILVPFSWSFPPLYSLTPRSEPSPQASSPSTLFFFWKNIKQSKQ